MTAATQDEFTTRSRAQRMEALSRANKIRTRRKQLKAELKDGEISAKALLLDPPEYIHTMKVRDLLMAVPKIGAVKSNTLLVRTRISPSKTMGGMSQRQRGELAGIVGYYS